MKTKTYDCVCGSVAYYIPRRGWCCVCNNPPEEKSEKHFRNEEQKVRVAFITIPDLNTPVDGSFNNMNGYWNPPSCVNSFWANACEINYTTEEQFEKDMAEVEESYKEMISQFYRDNAL